MPVTPSERDLIDRYCVEGPQAFYREGYTPTQVHEFMSRPDVKRLMSSLITEFRDSEMYEAIQKFALRRQLSRLAPGAVSVMAQSLVGPTYVREEDGSLKTDNKGRYVVSRAAPTRTQVRVAQDLLDRLGVVPDDKIGLPNVNVNVLIQKPKADESDVEIDYGSETYEDRALSRERMRTAMLQLTGRIQEAHTKVQKQLKAPARKRRSTRKPKSTAKSKSKRTVKSKSTGANGTKKTVKKKPSTKK